MPLDRRTMLKAGGFIGATTAIASSPGFAASCHVGPSPHDKGPKVWMDMDQIELDSAYDQSEYAPMIGQILKRYASRSAEVRARLGEPKRFSYGATPIETLDVFPAKTPNAPIFVFVHGGAWRSGEAKDYAFPAELFVNAGVNFVVLDFMLVDAAKGDIGVMAQQVRNAIAWTYKNAATFGADASRFYVGGHSSGGHLCGQALVTDWQKEFGLPADFIKGGLCMSGLYDMKPVRMSKRSAYVKFTDEMEGALSTQRQIERLRTPIIITYGTFETPEFQRQSRDFAAVVKTAGKPVELIEAPNYNHFEMCETLADPYGPNGRAALRLIKST